MKQFYAIKTYKQYDRDVKLAVRRTPSPSLDTSSASATTADMQIFFRHGYTRL